MFQIYSENVTLFLKRILRWARLIVSEEMRLPCKSKRFLFQNYYYPLSFVVFEHPKQLGFFNASMMQIGLNKRLMFEAKDHVIKNVIRHELAHYYLYISKGQLDHSREFRQVCKDFGWGEDVYSSQEIIQKANDRLEGDLKQESLMNKVKKLIKLGESSNEHEAQLALSKANQLILKYQLDKEDLEDRSELEETETIYSLKVLFFKKTLGKERTIYSILKTFFVYPVFNHGKGSASLEVYGQKHHVEIAQYVATFLNEELERLWDAAKKKSENLSGIRHKNSFFAGIEEGYMKTLKEINTIDFHKDLSQNFSHLSHENQVEVLNFQKKLQIRISQVVPGLRSVWTPARTPSQKAYKMGQKAGEKLKIHQGVESSKVLLLS